MRKGYWIVILIVGSLLLGLSTVSALEGEMADEFVTLSSMTQQAMELSPLELGALVERCDRLLEQTASLKASEKKITRKRIERLRKLFLYVLSSKSVAKEERTGT